MEHKEIVETIQKMAARLVATSPAGYRLFLIGGFRYRLLDGSARMSNDIDYHWDADLAAKQQELISLFQRKLIAEVNRQFGYDGSALPATGPDADSPSVRIISLAFWQSSTPASRIEIPVEITRIFCSDKMTVRTADGVVYPTASDQDIIESKIISVFNRLFFQHRDLLDIFLFSNRLIAESPVRIKGKMIKQNINKKIIQDRMDDLENNSSYHIKSINHLLDSQVDAAAADNLKKAGGGEFILRETIKILRLQITEFLKQ
jgi:hypothetical protein